MMSKSKRRFIFAVFIVSALALLTLAALGVYDRPQNDDFLYLADNGVTPHNHFYWTDNGRLGSLVSYYLLYPLPHILQMAPAFTLLLFVTSLAVFIAALIKWQGGVLRRDVLLLSSTIACCLALATCFMVPSLYANFFWFAALPPHTWSFCLVILYIGLLIHRLLAKKWPLYIDVLLFLVVPFLIGTFYEAAALILTAASLVGLILCYRQKLTKKLQTLWFSLIGSILSLGFLLLSPGALRRQRLSTGQHSDTMFGRLVHLPGVLSHNLFYTLPRYLQEPELLLIILAAGVVVGLAFVPQKVSIRTTIWWGVLIVLAVLLFIGTDMGVTWIGLHEFQTVREYFSLVLGLVLGSFLLGVVAGQYASQSQRHTQRVIFGTSIGIMGIILLLNLAYIPVLRQFRSGIITYATLWDKEDQQIRRDIAKGQCKIAVDGLAISGSWHLNSKPRYWVGYTAMSEYYKLPKPTSSCTIYAKRIVKPFGNTKFFESPPG